MNKLIVTTLAIACLGCNTSKNAQPVGGKELIKDCPDEKIINKMPVVSKDGKAPSENSYYIYKGARKELGDFDENYLKKNCNVKVTEVH